MQLVVMSLQTYMTMHVVDLEDVVVEIAIQAVVAVAKRGSNCVDSKLV